VYSIFLPLIIILCITVVYADSATQTDWSGGDGIYGPVIDWGNEFFMDTDVSYSNPSDLVLLPLEHTVDEDFDYAGSVFSADVNGDGYMDVLGAASIADDITWWENVDGTGTSWTEHTVDGDFTGAQSVFSADVNGDGYMDVLGAAYNAHDIAWWENVDGSGTSWTEHTVDGDFVYATSVYSADVNGNGYTDVLGAASIADDITWWENVDGSGTSWTEHTVDGDFDGANSVFSADVNGDGYMDVLGTAWAADDITWWENVGGSGTSWTEHTVDGDFWAARSVYSADVNGDGYMDVLGAAAGIHDITWWENVGGTGTSWTEHIVDGEFYGAWSVFSADVNGDGYMDVLGAAIDADYITWWDLTSYVPDGSLESSILDTQLSPNWDYFEWNSQTPPGTSVSFQVRASNDHTAMGAWSDTLSIPCLLQGILTDGDQYVQYRVILETSDPDTTPVLFDLTLTWDPVSIGDTTEPIPPAIALLPIAPNPTAGSPIIRFGLPEPASVDISIFDLSGRRISEIHGNDYSPGYHDALVGDLSPGVYFCRMISGDFSAMQRFVVIE